MFIGHYAVGFGAKKVAPYISLGTLFLASQMADLLWSTLLLLKIETVAIVPGITKVTPLDFKYYPFSHSLLASIVWALFFGALYYIIRRRIRGSIVIASCVILHWILDLISHRPDLPDGLGSTTHVGLGLWNSIPATLLFEGGIFAIGVVLYIKTTLSNNKRGLVGFWLLVALLVIIYLGNFLGGAPPDIESIGFAGTVQWLFVLWGYWVDKHRTAKQLLISQNS